MAPIYPIPRRKDWITDDVHLPQQSVECPLDDRSRVAALDLVGEQVLKLLELVPRALVEGDLELVAARREWHRIG